MRTRRSVTRSWTTQGGLALGVALLVALPVGTFSVVAAQSAPGSASGARALFATALSPLAAPTNSTLTVGNLTGTLGPDFFGTTVSNEVHMLRNEADVLNATPARVIVWPGAMAGEDYDPFTDTHYNTYDGTPTTAVANESQFVQTCEAIHCTAIVQVPAEIDDPSFAEAIVNYTEVNLSFHPAYWMIGNEPELWEHWKVPWSQWGTRYTTGPTPTQFGDEVVAYVNAIRAVDNTTPILGLPASGCTCGYYTFSQWISGVLAVTGNKIQAVAFHEYPAGWLGTGDGSLLDFYVTLQTSVNIPTRIASARAAVTSACPDCNVSVFVSELGSALSWSDYGQYAAGFSGALSIAAQMTQAMDVNLSNIDLFAAQLPTSNSWFNQTGYARPDYALYSQILSQLGPQIYPVNLTGLGLSLYAVATNDPSDAGRQDLLVVNANITHAVRFTPQFPDGVTTSPVEALYWNGSIHTTRSNGTTWVEPFTPEPIPQLDAAGLPSAYVLPPQSMVLFQMYPSGGTFVNLSAQGVPTNVSWFASVGPHFYTTTSSNLSLLLAPGSYPVQGVAIPLPIGGKEFNPAERLSPFAPSPVSVAGEYSNFTVPFVTQWRVNVSASPRSEGTAGPDVGWWNQSQPLTATATPANGYAFTRWSGWGPGSYNGSDRTITLDPTGRINETAHFEVGSPAVFWAEGLPAGTPWSVTTRGFTTNTTASSLTLYSLNGTWGFQVAPVPGYRILPQNGSFNPLGPGTFIRFVKLTPPPPVYAVHFEVTGLPANDTVSITVRTLTATAGVLVPEFALINGTYAYQVGYVAGYHAAVPLKLFNVTGGPLTVVVPFVPTVYSASWEVTGLWSGVNWSVVVAGVPLQPNAAWASTTLVNGSYPYTVLLPANFTTSPRTGTLVVNGNHTVIALNFSLQRFLAGFEATGGGAMQPWSVRLGDVTLNASANRSMFTMANGTYTFTVYPPAGYYAVPSHGNLTVAGPVPFRLVTFLPVSAKPSAALIAALTSGALLVSAWIGISVVVGFVLVRRMRRRGA